MQDSRVQAEAISKDSLKSESKSNPVNKRPHKKYQGSHPGKTDSLDSMAGVSPRVASR